MPVAEERCSMLRRFAAIFYDILCLIALFFGATMALVLFTDGEAVASNNIVYDFYLLLMAYLYFVCSWANGGQTLGMRAWRIKLRKRDPGAPDWYCSSMRFGLALLSFISFGAGFFWAAFSRHRLTFHDIYSGTSLVLAGDGS